MANYCGECGNKLVQNDLFCTSCGSKVGNTSKEPPVNNKHKQSSFTDIQKIGFNKAITLGYSKYSDFKSRSTKAEYWYFILFQFVIGLFISFVSVVYTAVTSNGATVSSLADVLFGAVLVLAGIFYLVNIIPTLAVTVRRLHDTGKSAVYLLIYFIPYIGPLILLFAFLIQNGELDNNKYGEAPNLGK